jgi:anti-anti-sigma regulatory factor
MSAILKKCPEVADKPRETPMASASAGLIANIIHNDRTVIVRIEGQAGVAGLEQLHLPFLQLVARRTAVAVFDFSLLTILSSLVMGQMVRLRRDIGRWNGCVRIACCPPAIRESLEVAGLDRLFEFHASVEDAISAI